MLAVGSIFKFTIYSGRRLATCYAHLVVGGGRRVAHREYVVINLLVARFALDDVDATTRYAELAFEGSKCSVELCNDVVDFLYVGSLHIGNSLEVGERLIASSLESFLRTILVVTQSFAFLCLVETAIDEVGNVGDASDIGIVGAELFVSSLELFDGSFRSCLLIEFSFGSLDDVLESLHHVGRNTSVG